MDDRPRNVRTMLSEAKDTSELMVDLAYAALYFDDPEMATEVDELDQRLSHLLHDMRAICVLAVRSPREAEQMSSVLKVISAIERVASNAVDIGRIVTHRLGIPRALVADLAGAEEVSHRVRVREGSGMANRPLAELELPIVAAMWIMAIHRDRDWLIGVDGDEVLQPDDVLFLRGAAEGIDRVRELAGAPVWEPPQPPEDGTISDLDRAIDTLVEMKNLSEVAVGLGYSALVLHDRLLAAEVNHLEDRLDEMKERLELWVLRAAAEQLDPSALRGLLHLAQTAEDLGDQAQHIVWLVQQDEELHPVLGLALGETEEVVAQVPVAQGSPVAGRTLRELALPTETGFHILAIRRRGRYVYRPRSTERLREGDELIATGPEDGYTALAERCGYVLFEDDETGERELVPASEVTTTIE